MAKEEETPLSDPNTVIVQRSFLYERNISKEPNDFGVDEIGKDERCSDEVFC